MDARSPAVPAATRGQTRRAAAILGLLVAAIAAVFAVQAAGYPPCELCLAERWPYYIGIVLALATTLAAARRAVPAAEGLVRAGFAALAALFLFSAGFGAYHAGVEWGFWAGPTGCTGAVARAATPADFLHQLQSVKVVRCDAAALRILGLSLAGWNALLSLLVAALAIGGMVRPRRADRRDDATRRLEVVPPPTSGV